MPFAYTCQDCSTVTTEYVPIWIHNDPARPERGGVWIVLCTTCYADGAWSA